MVCRLVAPVADIVAADTSLVVAAAIVARKVADSPCWVVVVETVAVLAIEADTGPTDLTD